LRVSGACRSCTTRCSNALDKAEVQTEGLRATAFVRSTRQHVHQPLCRYPRHGKKQSASSTSDVCVRPGWTAHARLALPAAESDSHIPIGPSFSRVECVCRLLHTRSSISHVGAQAREHVSGPSVHTCGLQHDNTWRVCRRLVCFHARRASRRIFSFL